MLRSVRTVIVDEIHALLRDKRGSHLALSLERLEALAGPYQRIGLSATQNPLSEVGRSSSAPVANAAWWTPGTCGSWTSRLKPGVPSRARVLARAVGRDLCRLADAH
jgi:ATP-dependent Lhr-like helicase